jgi:hypothetical protein
VGGETLLVGRQSQGVVQQVGFGHRSTQQQAKEARAETEASPPASRGMQEPRGSR